MTLVQLSIRNALFRNPTRSILTVLGTMTTVLAFIFLRTVLAAWYAGAEASASDRLITRNAISLTQPLPRSYVTKVKDVPGVAAVTYSNWFGGIYKDRKNFFAQFAIEAPGTLEMYDIQIVEGSKEDFLKDRSGSLVGKTLAAQYGFKVGGIVPLQGDIYPGDWRFNVSALIDSKDPGVSQTMYFHWDRLNDGLPEGRKDQIGVITTKVLNANDSPKVIQAIDAVFANSPNETHTETEKSFQLSFITGSEAILGALQAVSLVILVIMALILGNTLAMGMRERTSELGAMRAIGFLPHQILWLAVGEGVLLGALGGALGIAISNPILNGFGKALTELGFLSDLRFDPVTATITLVAALVIGGAASFGPALVASKLDVVTALRRQE